MGSVIFYFFGRNTTVVHHWDIGTFAVNRNIQLVSVDVHVHFVTSNSAVSTIESMVCLGTEQPDFCSRQMIGKTGKKERFSIKVEFVECCSHPNNSVGSGNVIYLNSAFSVVDEVTAKRRQAKRCASIPHQRTVLRGLATFAPEAIVRRIVSPEEIVAMDSALSTILQRDLVKLLEQTRSSEKCVTSS